MTPRLRIAVLVIAFAALITLHHSAFTPVVRAAAQQPGTSTLDDQTELAVTVYNSDIALVRDVRNLELARGTSDLHFMDIAATVNPATVHFRSLTEPSRVRVLEQNYEYDLLEPDKLLHKYVGRDVTLVRGTGETTARLISYNTAPIWRINGEIVTGMQADHIRFPELPGNLYSRPTLIWTLDNSGGARHRVEASYLAGKLSWNADYVLTVARDDKAADIDGWVTVTNGSGTSFNNAKLQLVAGDLNRVRQVIDKLEMKARRTRAAGAPAMAQEAFSDYHLYTLGRKDDDQQQRDEAGEHARRHRLPRAEALRRRRPERSTTATRSTRARRSRTSCRSTTSSRTKRTAGSACRCRPAPCASISPIRAAACSSSAKTASTTRRKTKRST